MNEFENKIICGDWIEELKKLPDNVFHCCVTSPPYWGQRDYGVEGQLGLEKTPEEHIEKLVEGFREVRRVLRPDGVLFLNYGDKYATTPTGNFNGGSEIFAGRDMTGHSQSGCRTECNLQQGNLLMLPARVALALQADGWILRDDIIWAKAISFNDKYSGSTMPESVNGWRWDRHRIKVKSEKAKVRSEAEELSGMRKHSGYEIKESAEWQDCPGCEKCEANDGLVLRKGSWRCTKAHEHLFQFVKSNDYFCDMEAVRETLTTDPAKLKARVEAGWQDKKGEIATVDNTWKNSYEPSGRNLRNVWTINPRGYKEAHYATYPEKLVEPCIKVATSSKGVCPKCGSQWARIVETKGGTTGQSWHDHSDDIGAGQTQGKHPGGVGAKEAREGNPYTRKTLGFKPTCECNNQSSIINNHLEPVPALVLDPFIGSGTTAVVAVKLGRNYFGTEINSEYKNNHIDERIVEAETGVPLAEARTGQGALFE